MNQINAIKEMNRKGMIQSEIVKTLKVDRKTVIKYLAQADFVPTPLEKKELPSKLDNWKEIIDAWLEEDSRMRFKQRHTARRVHNRLTEEYPDTYDCSYPLVQRYCKKKREERRNERNGFLELVWHPGEAQVDFGEADCYENETIRMIKFLCLSFPSSNAGYIQLFGGETAECITHGLSDLFQRIGGVPRRLVVDNTSAIGRRIGEKIRLSELFMRFKCHYDFEVTFCNPYSGNEKGNVENKVGYMRRNFLVPAPEFTDIEDYNRTMLERCERDWQRDHYKKHRTISDLFEEDKQALFPLPSKPFAAYRLEKVTTDAYGKFCLDGKHYYSSKPECGKQPVIAQIGAHHVDVLDASGVFIARHRREFGCRRSDTSDYSTTAARLFRNPGAWKNSGIREELPENVRRAIDAMDTAGMKNALSIIRDLTPRYGFDAVIAAMEEAVNLSALSKYNAEAIARRIVTSGIASMPENGPDLSAYDSTLLPSGGVQ